MTRLEQFRGMGATNTQIAQTAIAGSAPIIGGALIAAGMVTGPVGMAITGAITLGSYIAQAFAGCGQTCVQATAIVNQIEPYLKQNVANYLNIPTPRPKSAQTACLGVFTNAWNQVVAACGNAALGSAGQRCISDRQRGGKWDWFSYYYDPIANDSSVYDDSVTGTLSTTASSLTTSAANVLQSMTGGSWLGIAAILGIGLLLISGGGKK
jgi:hypothetical protein